MFYYTRGVLYAVRKGPYKLHLWTREPIKYGRAPIRQDPPLLYHVEHDPGEQFDLAAKNPAVVAELLQVIAEHEKTVKPAVDQLAIPLVTDAK